MITVFHYESPPLEEKKSSLNVQNLVPEIHCVQEIIGHSSPSVPDSNTSSSFEKKC